MIPHVIVVGADKGGVGKTTISRALVDYFASHGISHRAFDTESEVKKGVLKRFHPEKTTVVDLAESDDQMKVFDTLREAQVSLIDIRAGLLTPILKTLNEIGFFDGVRESRLRLSVVHVVGSNTASFDEIEQTAKLIEGAKHHVALNHINKSKFIGLPEGLKSQIEIGQLEPLAADTVDRLGIGFNAFVARADQSETLRGYVRSWMRRTFAAFDSIALNT